MRKSALKQGRTSRTADDYLNLVRQFPLRPIRSVAQYTAAAAILDRLAVREEGSLTEGEQDYFDALTTFVELYDDEHADVKPPSDPKETLRSLMEHRQMTTSDLGKLFGNSKGVASEILSGKRAMSLKTINRLAAHFRVPPAVFLPSPVS
jgi:HTH-type transcriptional regulator / antitoxin HigA